MPADRAPIPTTQPRSSDALSMDSMFGRYIGYRPVLHRSLKVLVGQPGGSGVFVQKFILIGCHRGYHKRYKSHSIVKNICELPNTNPSGYDRPILHLVADEKHPSEGYQESLGDNLAQELKTIPVGHSRSDPSERAKETVSSASNWTGINDKPCLLILQA